MLALRLALSSAAAALRNASGVASIEDIPSTYDPDVPWSLPGRDVSEPVGRTSVASLTTPATGPGMVVAGDEVLITHPGPWVDYDFRGKYVLTATGLSEVEFNQCLFDDDAAATSAGSILRFGSVNDSLSAPLTTGHKVHNCTFDLDGTERNSSPAISGRRAEIDVYRVRFNNLPSDALRIGAGRISHCYFNKAGLTDTAHVDNIEWTHSAGVLEIDRNYSDLTMFVDPTTGGINSFLKNWEELSGTLTHAGLVEENYIETPDTVRGCLFPLRSDDEDASTGKRRWFRNVLNFVTSGDYVLTPLNANVTAQDNKTLAFVDYGTEYNVGTPPAAPSVSLASAAGSRATPTFSLPTAAEYVEGRWRVIGTARWSQWKTVTTTVPVVGLINDVDATWEFEFRGVDTGSGGGTIGPKSAKQTLVIAAPPYNANSQRYFDRLALAAIEPDASRRTLINALIAAGVADGWWAKMLYFGIFAANAQAVGQEQARFNCYPGVPVGALTFVADRGFRAAGTGRRLDTGLFIPADMQNDISFGVYPVDAALPGANGSEFGNENSRIVVNTTGTVSTRANSTLTLATSAIYAPPGLIGVTRRNSADYDVEFEGVAVETETRVSATPDTTVAISFCAQNGASPAPGQMRIGLGYLARALTSGQIASLSAASTIYMQGVGAVP